MAWIALDFGAKCRHASIDATVIHNHLVSPDPIEDLIPGKSTASPMGKKLEESKFLRGEFDFSSVFENLVGVEIQFAVAEFDDFKLLGVTAADEAFHAGYQFANAKGFGNVVIGA